VGAAIVSKPAGIEIFVRVAEFRNGSSERPLRRYGAPPPSPAPFESFKAAPPGISSYSLLEIQYPLEAA
jgi:hypothetical protein